MKNKKTNDSSTYVMVYKHGNDTCSLPPPPKQQPIKRQIMILVKLFRLYTGL